MGLKKQWLIDFFFVDSGSMGFQKPKSYLRENIAQITCVPIRIVFFFKKKIDFLYF